MQHVAVIGAGASGLVCARELARAGLNPRVLEGSEHVGGTWVYSEGADDDPTGLARTGAHHGSMYASLRTNLPRDIMAFRDFPFDSRGGGEDAWPRFVGHREVATYLERFADHFGVRRSIAFDRRVTGLEHALGRWRVTSTGANGTRAELFDAVAVCNGHYHRTVVPPLPGLDAFEGRVLHSHNYRTAEPFVGRRVALLGAKASGIDLSGELAGIASSVFLCAQEPATIATRPQIEVRHPIVELGTGRSVVLADGERLEAIDDIILCTGYRYHFPFLAPDNPWVGVKAKWVHPLWLDAVAIRAPTLAFIGLPMQVVPFPQVEIQSRLFAHLLSGRIALPRRTEMMRDHREQLGRLAAAGIAQRHWLLHGPRQFSYYDALARRVGSPPLPAWFQPLYEAVGQARRSNPAGYRDDPLPDARA